jgi:murein hydrolase activator
MAERRPCRQTHRAGRPVQHIIMRLTLIVVLVVGSSAGLSVARAGLLVEPALEPATTTATVATMLLGERQLERKRLIERQARLERDTAVTAAVLQGAELRLRRLAADFASVRQEKSELTAEIALQRIEITKRQQRLEALLAEIVQLSRDETGDPRRLAQLRAVAASLAQPFAAAKAALAETRSAQADLDDHLAQLQLAAVEARQALGDANARGEWLALARSGTQLRATEAARRAAAAEQAAAAATRRLDRVMASRTLATTPMPTTAIDASTAAVSPDATTLEPEALTAHAAIAPRRARRPVHYDLPEMALVGLTPSGRDGAVNGSRVMPVAGAVVSRFGEGQEPPFDRGLVIEVEDRRLVRAPRDGRVVFARAYEGFGLLLIIDHGNEYHSLLSGLSRFVVHEGWTVRAGQMVGTLEPGAETAGRLYVELRRRGVPVDPLTWFAAGQDKVRS